MSISFQTCKILPDVQDAVSSRFCLCIMAQLVQYTFDFSLTLSNGLSIWEEGPDILLCTVFAGERKTSFILPEILREAWFQFGSDGEVLQPGHKITVRSACQV